MLVQQAPVNFLHHTAWEVDDVDEVGRGATAMLEDHPERHVWGLGRHHIGSNFFWYLRDPAGNFSEYYSDMDAILDDQVWEPAVVARGEEPLRLGSTAAAVVPAPRGSRRPDDRSPPVSSRAVRFSRYGGSDVLEVVDVEVPHAGPGEIVVAVVAAATNPGEIMIRQGAFADVWPATFPEGQGNDFSGRVAEVGPGATGFSPGDEVMGFAPRRGQADYVASAADRLARKPADVPWEVAAVLGGSGATAFAAVRAVGLKPGETVVVAAAAGGVGVVAAQLARLAGARVIGTAGEGNAEFLRSLGVEPVRHGDGLVDRIKALAPEGVDAYLDNFGAGNVEAAIRLGVLPDRINTIIDGTAAERYGTHADAQEQANSPEVWEELAGLVAAGRLTIPIHAVYPLERVRDAYDELAARHTRGKIVLRVAADAG